MERKTFKNKKVQTWLKEHAIAAAFESDKHLKLVDAYKVVYHPTLIFFKSDGSVAWREVGYCDSAKFLQIVAWLKEGKTPLQAAREAVAAKPKVGMNRIILADRHLEVGERAQAVEVLAKLLAEMRAGHFSDLNRSSIYERLDQCGDEAASTVLSAEYEGLRATFLSGKISRNDLFDLRALAPIAKKSLLPLYDEAKQAGIAYSHLDALDPLMTDELLAAERYQDATQVLSIEARAARLHEMGWLLSQGLKGQTADLIFMSKWEHEANLFHLLLGLKRVEEAKQLAEKILKDNPTWMNYNRLARIAFVTRAIDEQMIAWSRQAYELTGGKSVGVIITYASSQIVTGHMQEARAILEQGLESAPEEGEDRETLIQMIEKLKLKTS